MLDLSEERTFRPELLSRRAEWLTWALSALMLVTWWFLRANEARFAGTAMFLLIFLLFAAVGTSLGNWMDRKTVLRLDSEGLSFRNGLRDVRLGWEEVENIRVLPATAGAKRVQVIGARSHFEFRTLAELHFSGEVKGRSGFAAGDEILQTILKKTGLARQPASSNVTYYARK